MRDALGNHLPARIPSLSFKIVILYIFPITLATIAIIAPQVRLRLSSILTRVSSPYYLTKLLWSPRTLRTMPITSDLPYAHERHVAELAVQRAARLTQEIYNSKVKGTITKDDKSPVTS